MLLAAALSLALGAPLAACQIAGVEGEARCGSYSVLEDRSNPAGRRIALRVVVLRALGPEGERAPEALVFLSGGPGEAASEGAAGLAGELRELRRERDLLLVDQRGTGESNPLRCDLWSGGLDLSALVPVAAVRRCREEVERLADPRHYTSAEAAEDLEEVRAWLGYPRLDVIGGSYGTRLAQVYARRHPERVRTLLLRGVVSFGDHSPLFHARNAQRALDLLADECAADPACARSYPRFRQEVDELLARLATAPARVRITHPASGEPIEVSLTRSVAAEVIRFSLYRQGTARQLPLLVHGAHGGDLADFATTAVAIRAELPRALAFGTWLSSTCAEDVATIDAAQIPAATAGTFLGEDRVREQMAACAVWPHRPAPAEFHVPLSADLPTVLVSGERDPVTPPSNAASVARNLPRALDVVQPFGAHGGQNDCLDRLVTQFVRTASLAGLDTSCLAGAKATEFALDEGSDPDSDPDSD